MPEWLVFSVGIAIIIVASSLSKFVCARARQTHDQERPPHYERLEQRLTEMDGRLADMQEVLLAIDEKLERLETEKQKA